MFNWMMTAFGKAENAIRSRIAMYIKAHSDDPKPMTRTVLHDWSAKSAASMLAHAYDVSKWILSESMVKETIDDSTHDEAYWLKQFSLFTYFRDSLEMFPITDSHLTLLNNVLGLLVQTHVDLEEPLSCDEFYTKFREFVIEYANSACSWFENFHAKTPADLDSANKSRYFWYSGNHPHDGYTYPTGGKDIKQEHIDAVASLVNAMTHNQVPDEVVLFMLVPSLASAGYTFLDKSDIPFYVYFMPYKWIINGRDEIWSLRMQNKFEDEEQFYDPSDIDTTFLKQLGEAELDDLPDVNDDTYKPQAPTKGKGKRRDPMDEKPHGPPPPSKNKKKKDQPQGPDSSSSGQPPQPPPPSPQGPQQPQVPDDSAYVPNWILARQVKYQIRDIKAKNPFPDYFDHMTHFSTTDEIPRTVPSANVTNRDIKVFKGTSLLDGYYILTFTRMSRKPIFNPVI